MEHQSRGWLTLCIPYLRLHIRWGRGTGIFQSTRKRNWVYTTSNRQSSPGEKQEFSYNIVIIGISIKGLAYTLNPIFGASYSVRMRPRKDQSLIGVKIYNVLKINDIQLFYTSLYYIKFISHFLSDYFLCWNTSYTFIFHLKLQSTGFFRGGNVKQIMDIILFYFKVEFKLVETCLHVRETLSWLLHFRIFRRKHVQHT